MKTKGYDHDEPIEQAPATRRGDGTDDRPQARGDRATLPAVAEEPWPVPLAAIAAAVLELEQPEHDDEVEYVRMSAHQLGWEYARADLSHLSIGEALRGLRLLARIGDLATRTPRHVPTLVPAMCVGCRQPIFGRYVNDDDARALRCDACRED